MTDIFPDAEEEQSQFSIARSLRTATDAEDTDEVREVVSQADHRFDPPNSVVSQLLLAPLTAIAVMLPTNRAISGERAAPLPVYPWWCRKVLLRSRKSIVVAVSRPAARLPLVDLADKSLAASCSKGQSYSDDTERSVVRQ